MKKGAFDRKIEKEDHVRIYIFNDETVAIARYDKKNKLKKLLQGEEYKALPGPTSTYDQAVWRADNTCVWFRGKKY